jgi:hypothetical protein
MSKQRCASYITLYLYLFSKKVKREEKRYGKNEINEYKT